MGYKEQKQRQFDIRYLQMARVWAENSYCVRRKVGALLVKDNMIISDGYNGTPAGFENICEDDMGKTKPYVLHAEANAITKVAKSANNCNGSTEIWQIVNAAVREALAKTGAIPMMDFEDEGEVQIPVFDEARERSFASEPSTTANPFYNPFTATLKTGGESTSERVGGGSSRSFI